VFSSAGESCCNNPGIDPPVEYLLFCALGSVPSFPSDTSHSPATECRADVAVRQFAYQGVPPILALFGHATVDNRAIEGIDVQRRESTKFECLPRDRIKVNQKKRTR
jgi:hypothetical protein